MFSERLKKLRLNNNLSQLKLAKMINITQQALSKWENELSFPDLDSLKKISNYFNVSIDYLLGNDKPINKEFEEMEQLKNLLKEKGLINADNLTEDEVQKLIDIYNLMERGK